MSDHNTSDLYKKEHKSSKRSEGEGVGFRNALFVNPINCDPDLQIQECQDGVEQMMPFSDSFFSGKTRQVDNGFNFNCLSSDLLQRLEEGSPIKSSRTFRADKKIQDVNLLSIEEDEEDGKQSLFCKMGGNKSMGSENHQARSKWHQQASLSDNEDEFHQNYIHYNFSNLVGQDRNFPSHEEWLGYIQHAPQHQTFSNNINIQNKMNLNNEVFKAKNLECSGVDDKNRLKDFDDNHDISYEDLMRKKFNEMNNNNTNYNNLNLNNKNYLTNNLNYPITNLNKTNRFSSQYSNRDYEHSNLSTNSNVSLGKKLSPNVNEEVSFFPKNFYSQTIFNRDNPNLKNYHPLSTTHQSMNTSIRNHKSANSMNPINQIINEPSSPEYLRNPLSLNSNINKIKKNANINSLVSNDNNTTNSINNINSSGREKEKDQNGLIAESQMQSASIQPQPQQQTKNHQGKTGWVCSLCKNFNYEIRVKCNRCGKPQSKNILQVNNNQVNNSQINNSQINNLTMTKHNVNNPTNLMANKTVYNNLSNVNVNKTANMGKIQNTTEKNTAVNSGLLSESESNLNDLKSSSDSSPQSQQSPRPERPEDTSSTKTNSSDSKKKKKPFVERVGDWVCIKCKNLNFSFRVVCNRCQLTKVESEKLFEQYMKNLMNYVKINELLQNQIVANQNLNMINQNQMQMAGKNSQQMTLTENETENLQRLWAQKEDRTKGNLGNLFSHPDEFSRLYDVGDYFNEESLSERMGNNSK